MYSRRSDFRDIGIIKPYASLVRQAPTSTATMPGHQSLAYCASSKDRSHGCKAVFCLSDGCQESARGLDLTTQVGGRWLGKLLARDRGADTYILNALKLEASRGKQPGLPFATRCCAKNIHRRTVYASFSESDVPVIERFRVRP